MWMRLPAAPEAAVADAAAPDDAASAPGAAPVSDAAAAAAGESGRSETLVVLGLEEAEREVLLTAGDLVLALVASEPGAARPQDPALLRLLPDVVDDPDEAADLRRLSHDDVRRAKAEQLHTLRRLVQAADPEAEISRGDAPAVTAALSQLRLVLADRLGVLTDEDSARLEEEIDSGSADRDRTYLATVWRMLGALQAALVERMLADLDG